MQQPRSNRLSAVRRIVDVGEFARFVLTGVLATCANLGAVWLARNVVAYHFALVAGVIAGASVSFPMSKRFAFRSTDWQRSHREFVRFAIVYAGGVIVYWAVAMICGRAILPTLMPRPAAELAGAFLGAGVMTFTSYFGHRYYTYRDGRAGA